MLGKTYRYALRDSISGGMTVFLKCAMQVEAWYSLGAKEQSASVTSSPVRKGPPVDFRCAEVSPRRCHKRSGGRDKEQEGRIS